MGNNCLHGQEINDKESQRNWNSIQEVKSKFQIYFRTS